MGLMVFTIKSLPAYSSRLELSTKNNWRPTRTIYEPGCQIGTTWRPPMRWKLRYRYVVRQFVWYATRQWRCVSMLSAAPDGASCRGCCVVLDSDIEAIAWRGQEHTSRVGLEDAPFGTDKTNMQLLRVLHCMNSGGRSLVVGRANKSDWLNLGSF
jgi:hypothetical protein